MSTVTLPHWDLAPLFTSLDSPEFAAAWSALGHKLDGFAALLDQHDVADRSPRPEDAGAFVAIIEAWNDLLEEVRPLIAYLHGLVSTDATNAAGQGKLSELQQQMVRYQQLMPRLTAWLAKLDPDQIEAGDYALLLAEARVAADHLMSGPEEHLSAEMGLTGSTAWNKLYENVSSLITAEVDGELLPITAIRNLARHPEEATRRAAYEAELAAWKANEVPLAAAMNGVKGQTSLLNRRRGWAADVDPTLFGSRMSRAALDAMQTAAVASFPDFRRYWAAKARALGKETLDWWDLLAPVGESNRTWDWDEAHAFVVEQLAGFSSRDAELADRAFRERWIDAEPRTGKRGGAFCMPIGNGLSRILANYDGTFDSVSTLAHELGHAYHNLNQEHVPALLRANPMTLAETASIMNETVIVQAALGSLPEEDRLPILETDLLGSAQVVVDIHSRYLFETAVFAERSSRELSPGRLSELMEQAQRDTYADAVATYHPYAWAAKPHYTSRDFYNYPYTFGLLYGLGLYRRYEQDPDGFVAGYDDMLASTGMFDAATLAARYGIDLEDRGFWEQGLDVIRDRIDQFVALIG